MRAGQAVVDSLFPCRRRVAFPRNMGQPWVRGEFGMRCQALKVATRSPRSSISIIQLLHRDRLHRRDDGHGERVVAAQNDEPEVGPVERVKENASKRLDLPPFLEKSSNRRIIAFEFFCQFCDGLIDLQDDGRECGSHEDQAWPHDREAAETNLGDCKQGLLFAETRISFVLTIGIDTYEEILVLAEVAGLLPGDAQGVQLRAKSEGGVGDWCKDLRGYIGENIEGVRAEETDAVGVTERRVTDWLV